MVVLENLVKSYSSDLPVLDHLNLTIKKGEFVSIMGSSGSGKSTLMNMISALDKPTSGTIYLDHIPVHLESERNLVDFRRNKTGFVFQHHNLIPHLTLLENVLIAGYLSRKKKEEILAQANAYFKMLDISPIKNKYPYQVSGGEAQRAAIVRAIINQPLLLLADEPTGNLNSLASTKVMECFSQLNSKGQTLLMVTHDIKSAARGNRVLYLKDGRIVDDINFGKLSEVGLPERMRILNDWLIEKAW